MTLGTMCGMRPGLLFAIALLLLANAAIGTFVSMPEQRVLEVAFLDIGQGDAILITGPTGRQILIDGGRDRSVLRQLGKRMGPLDRSVNLVVGTHPDADHIGGLAGVLKSYAVNAYLSPDIPSETTPSRALAVAVEKEKGITEIVARRGMRILLGGGAYADVLYPDRDVSLVETNTGSVIMRVVYGETSFFLSGDAPEAVEDWLVRLDGEGLSSDVVKAGHHGSRTSTGKALLDITDPEVVVVSAGKDNPYGHPHAETLSRIADSGAVVVSTAEEGTIRFTSDGKTVRQK
jgi:competence protein ComEC